MLRELPPFLHFFFSIFGKSEESPLSLSTTKDKVDLDNFPPEVKGHVLHHLSYEQAVQLKSLCKGWNSLIQSDGFLQAPSLRENPWLPACYFFIENGVWQWAGFDPNCNNSKLGQSLSNNGKWRELPPLTFPPPNCDPDRDLFKQFLFCATEGLVCMTFSKAPHEERLIMFNPLTQEWKELSPLLHQRNPVLMHMYVNQSSKAYHILAAGSSASGEESLSRITDLYDSQTGQLERVGDLRGPAFALNEYQSGVFRNGNIFCIGFLELGDQTVKGILGYIVEGLRSTKCTDRGLPNSTILQLVENDGELILFSEQDSGPLTEHWVDRIEWISSEGDDEEKTDTFTLVNVLKKAKSGGRSLEVYLGFALVPFSEWQLCIYNTVDHIGEVFDIGDEEQCEALPALPEGFQVLIGILSVIPEDSSPQRNSPDHSPDHSRSNFLGFTVLRDTTRARMSSAPGFGRSLGCFLLCAVGLLRCLRVVGASPASAPGPSSSSPQISSTYYPILWYVGVGATIVGTAIGVIALGVKLYNHMRERRDSVRGVLDVLTRTFLKCPRGMCMRVGRLSAGEASVEDLRLEFPV